MFALRSNQRGRAQGAAALREQLSGGDGRSIGAADEVADAIRRDARQFADVIALMVDANEVVRGRAADAVEKASRARPRLLAPFKDALLGFLAGSVDDQVRWHVLQMVPRLSLSLDERRTAYAAAERSMASASRIVAVEALSAMFALAGNDAVMREHAAAVARQCGAAPGGAALRARARGLLWKHGFGRVDDDRG